MKVAGIPDPLQLFDGWEDEKAGISKRPPTFLSDIPTYFLSNGDMAHVNSVLKDYKLGKAYEYFVSGCLKEVFYHSLSKSSLVCVLRGKCCLSQRLQDDLHDIWACIDKLDRSIKAAYCSCIAGLGQTCNHIAALLFRFEAANRFGVSSCKLTLCAWNVPPIVKKLEPSRLSD
ncbi:hypothetical protein KUTeg_020882 [Tegillarca granosa]|uniref:SWIM-type domain-containing protein n=1 Tax=Tegillarca granosa TaxID=220873 RepID=A0ABQ9E9P5_TEGGR|nr:hypothetical protein KUTeg_020882 [Tegillarca granosa]